MKRAVRTSYKYIIFSRGNIWSSLICHDANTSAASVPLALDTAVQDGRIKQGDLVMFEAMGGGFTWGASLARM